MVRTADSSLRVTGGKANRKGTSVTVRSDSVVNISPSSGSSDRGSGGLNPICHWATPKWQKSITDFFKNKPAEKKKDDVPLEEDGTNVPSGSGINKVVFYQNDKENVEPSTSYILPMEVEVTVRARTNKRIAEDEAMECNMGPPKKIKLDKNNVMCLEEMEGC